MFIVVLEICNLRMRYVTVEALQLLEPQDDREEHNAGTATDGSHIRSCTTALQTEP